MKQLKKLRDAVRKAVLINPNDLQSGFRNVKTWANMVMLALCSAWLAWMTAPAVEAWRAVDHAPNLFSTAIGCAVVALLAMVSITLLAASVGAAATLKALADRMQ